MTVTIPITYRRYEAALEEGDLPFPPEGIPCAR